MINETYKAMLKGKSIIRELSEYATARGKEIGYENVFDYSLGNPSVPCTEDYTDTVIAMYQNIVAAHIWTFLSVKDNLPVWLITYNKDIMSILLLLCLKDSCKSLYSLLAVYNT